MSYVWILIVTFHVNSGTAPMVIDNIASVEECERLKSIVYSSFNETREARCFQVGKKP